MTLVIEESNIMGWKTKREKEKFSLLVVLVMLKSDKEPIHGKRLNHCDDGIRVLKL